MREEKKKYDALLIEKAKMEADHSETLDKLTKEHAAAIVAKDARLGEYEASCNKLTESNKELTTRSGVANGKFNALQDKLNAVRRGAVDALIGIDQNVLYLSDEDVRLKYNLALEEARTAEEYAKLCDRRARDFEDSLLESKAQPPRVVGRNSSSSRGRKRSVICWIRIQGPGRSAREN